MWETQHRRLTRLLLSGASTGAADSQLYPSCLYLLLILHGMKLDMGNGNSQLRPRILAKDRPWKDKGWELMVTLGNPSGREAFNVKVSLEDNEQWLGGLGKPCGFVPTPGSVRGSSLALGPRPISSPGWKVSLFLRKA